MPDLTKKALAARGLSPVHCRIPGNFSLIGTYLRYALLGFILILLGPLGCNSGSQTTSPASRPLCIAGSTSVQPFAEKLAEIYMHHHPSARIDVQGGGSSAGIYAATHGAADLGASSRELIGKEKKLIEIPIAYDGIALIVHPSNPLTNISLTQIRKIFSGAVRRLRHPGSLRAPGHGQARNHPRGPGPGF